VARTPRPRTAPTDWRQVPLCLSVNAAARVVGVSRPTLAREVASGRLPVLRLGTRVIVTQDALKDYLAENTR
jgi:excisionase family DNA binding protein